jgi:hypothetical protein
MTPALVVLALAVARSAPVASQEADSPWLYVIGSGGLLGILMWASRFYLDLRSGRAKAKETRTADLVTQRDDAYRERDEARHRERAADRRADRADRRADCEARNARRLWDYSAFLRRRLILLGVDEAELAEPELLDCDALLDDDEDYPPETRRGRPPGRR